MRIGIDARFYGPLGKGLGRYTQKLITSLEEIDSTNEYIIFLRSENWDDYKPTNKRFTKVRADYRWYTLKEQIAMPKIIKEQRVDLMHFTHFNVPLLYSGNFIVTIHDLILTKYPTQRATTLGPVKYWMKHMAYELIIRSAINRAKKIIAVTAYTKQEIINHFKVPESNIVVTHEAVDQAIPPRNDADEVLAKLHIKKPYVLYVGNAYPHKNIERLLAAFKKLLEKFPSTQLVLVGKEDYFYKRIKNEVDAVEITRHVVFPGYVIDDDLPVLYRHASIYAFPSLCEGFGLPALEACSYGTPVVASNNSCLPEVLGDAAIFFDPLQTSEITKAMSAVLTDAALVETLHNKGLQRVHNFSWRTMATTTLKLYNGV